MDSFLDRERAHAMWTEDPPPADMLKNWQKQNWRVLRQALLNPIFLPNYAVGAHQARADDSGPPKGKQKSWRGGKTIVIDGSKPCVVVGSDDVIALIVLPNYVRGVSLARMNRFTEELMKHELPGPASYKSPPQAHTPASKSINKKGENLSKGVVAGTSSTKARLPTDRGVVRQRNSKDEYNKETGVWGVRHLVKAWHAVGHQHSDSFAPSCDLVKHKSTRELTRRYHFVDARAPLDHRINHFVELAFPELSQLMRSARPALLRQPVIKSLDPIWHADFLGHAVLMNKKSGEHIDVSGVRRAWDFIVAGGDFKEGDAYFRDLNVRSAFPAGTALIFDGTAQRHGIQRFKGRQRISHVFFIHQSVFSELKIDTTLPDLTLASMKARLFPPEPEKPHLAPPISDPVSLSQSTKKKNTRHGTSTGARKKQRHE